MRRDYLKKVAVTLVSLVFSALPGYMYAADGPLPPSGSPVECSFLPQSFCTSNIYQFIGNLANWMVGIFGSLFVLVVIISGIQMASAADSPDRLKAAKGRLTNAVIGLVLLISFRAILSIFGITVGA